jgi:F-type H+-transporting ATPase subunit b
MDFLYDTAFWYLVSFLGFAAIIWKYGKPALMNYIDNRIEEIREEIATAENLRVEAQSMLAQYQRKHKDAVKDADQILATAKKQAAEIQKQAEKELDETIARREKQLSERLERMEENAKEEIRQYAASLAITATGEIISKTLDKKANEKLVDAAIKGVSENIH